MSSERKRRRRLRQRQIFHWTQGDHCAGCGRPLGLKRGLPRDRPDYPTYDHIMPKVVVEVMDW